MPDAITREYPLPGKPYIVHAGDELRDIAKAASVFGQPMTVRDILVANPGLDASRLMVGQKIIIPERKLNGPESAPGTPTDPASAESPISAPVPASESPP